MLRSRAFIWLTPLIALVAGGTLAGAAGGCNILDCPPQLRPKVSVVSSLTTVLFDRPVPSSEVGSEASLVAARNEFESFQIVVDAGSATKDIDVVAGQRLAGPGGAFIAADNVTIHRAVPYRVGGSGPPTSDSEGRPGLWADALIPEKDRFYGERRSAYPVDVGAGGRTVAWIDVFVPPGQRAGTYRGSIVVKDILGQVAEVPLTVRVLGFRIPSTTSLISSFRIDWREVCRAHTGDSRCRDGRMRWPLLSLYLRSALDNRVTLSNPVPYEADRAPRSRAERRRYRRHLLPLINGGHGGLRLRGARLTALSISWHCLEERGCLQRWRRLAARDGFARRFSLYLCDEPLDDPALWRECGQRARAADRQSAGTRKLVTASIQEVRGPGASLLGRINILVPLVNDLAGRPRSANAGNQRPEYDAFLKRRAGGTRRALWLYASCRSHGCEGAPPDSAATVGWPGYAIDQPASQARAFGWLAFLYRVSGELYYETTESLPSAWRDQYRFGGNGDGNLFYPGGPTGLGGGPAIGGRHEIPIESIRLKRIRDGREDYEYLKILAGRGRRAAAMAVVTGLFGPPAAAMHSSTVSSGDLARARAELATMIDAGRGG